MAGVKLLLLIFVFGASIFCVNGICRSESMNSNTRKLSRRVLKDAAKVTSMTIETSKTKCVEGKNYGFLGPVIWVSNGCKATFKVCFIKGSSILKTCKSVSRKPKSCLISHSKVIVSMIPEVHLSRDPCLLKYSYGFSASKIYATNGCKATFRVGVTLAKRT